MNSYATIQNYLYILTIMSVLFLSNFHVLMLIGWYTFNFYGVTSYKNSTSSRCFKTGTVEKKSKLVHSKTVYIQLVCSYNGDCKIRSSCPCTPGKVICASCFVDHIRLLEMQTHQTEHFAIVILFLPILLSIKYMCICFDTLPYLWIEHITYKYKII